jgi:holin-like protein
MNALTQLALLCAVCFAGEAASLLLPVPFPASVISMVLLFLLLLTGAVKLRHVEKAAGFLTRNMAFFFLPAAVEIMESFALVRESLLPLLAVLILTTIITFAVTAGTVKLCLHVQRRLERGRAA